MRYRDHVYKVVIKTISGDKFVYRKYFDYNGTEKELEEFKKNIFNEFNSEGFINLRVTDYKNDKCNSFDISINSKYIESISLIYETCI